MIELENKPKNVEEAIKAGWKTAKEMYTTCETSRQTWENFVADIRKSIYFRNQILVVTVLSQLKSVLQEHIILNTIIQK